MSPGSEADDAAAVGRRVRTARLSHGMSLRELARRLSVSPATVSAIETGSTKISITRLRAVADILDMSVSDVLGLEPGQGEIRDRWEPRAFHAVRPAPKPEPKTASEEWSDWRAYGPLSFDAVLAAALEEMLELGYHGATVRGIAARCGLSVPGIYHHYPSKQQMLYRILDLTMTDLLARAESARDAGDNPVQRFSNLVEHLALFHTRRRELGFIGAREMNSLGPDNRGPIACMRISQQRMVDREVAAAVQMGAFHTDDPRSASWAVVTMCTALPTWWRPSGPSSAEEIAGQYVNFGLDIMRYRRPLPPDRKSFGSSAEEADVTPHSHFEASARAAERGQCDGA